MTYWAGMSEPPEIGPTVTTLTPAAIPAVSAAHAAEISQYRYWLTGDICRWACSCCPVSSPDHSICSMKQSRDLDGARVGRRLTRTMSEKFRAATAASRLRLEAQSTVRP